MKTLLHRRHMLTSGFSGAKIDSLLITSPANWYYLAGFTGQSGALVVVAEGHHPHYGRQIHGSEPRRGVQKFASSSREAPCLNSWAGS